MNRSRYATQNPMTRGSFSLRLVGLAMILIPVALLSAVVMTAIVKLAEISLEQRLQGVIELIGRAVAPLISRHLDQGDRFMVQQSLQGVFDIGRVYGAAVYDHRGELIARAGRADAQVRTSEKASETVQTGQEGGSYRKVGRQDVYTFFTPLSGHGGRINGLLQVNRQRAEINAALSQLRTTSWIAWGGTVGVIGVLLFFVYRRLIEAPVHRLIEGMAAVTAGSRSTRLDVQRPQEFADLSRAFNSMIKAVDDAEVEREASRQRELGLRGRLRESEKIAAIGRVAAGIAHELGAPLSVIAGRSARIDRRRPDPETRHDLERIQRESARLKSIVEQLLEYCRGAERAHRPLDLVSTVGSAVGVVEQEHEEASQGIVLDWRAPRSRAWISGDRVRLEIAATNLLRNAMRHAEGRVRIGIEAVASGWRLSVADDGPGVAEDDVARLFEPFFTRQVSGRGTGLGLATVASVALEHDGEARYAGRDPELGGARFEMTFAALAEAAARPATAADQAAPPQQEPDHG